MYQHNNSRGLRKVPWVLYRLPIDRAMLEKGLKMIFLWADRSHSRDCLSITQIFSLRPWGMIFFLCSGLVGGGRRRRRSPIRWSGRSSCLTFGICLSCFCWWNRGRLRIDFSALLRWNIFLFSKLLFLLFLTFFKEQDLGSSMSSVSMSTSICKTLSAVAAVADVLWVLDSVVAAARPAETSSCCCDRSLFCCCCCCCSQFCRDSSCCNSWSLLYCCCWVLPYSNYFRDSSFFAEDTFRVRDMGQQILPVFHQLSPFTGTLSNFGGLLFPHTSLNIAGWYIDFRPGDIFYKWQAVRPSTLHDDKNLHVHANNNVRNFIKTSSCPGLLGPRIQ